MYVRKKKKKNCARHTCPTIVLRERMYMYLVVTARSQKQKSRAVLYYLNCLILNFLFFFFSF